MKNVFRTDESGVTAIEFALLLPVLVTIIMGSIELSMYLFVQSALEGATFSVSRLGKTGYVESGMTREETIRAAMADRLGIFFDPDRLSIISESYDDFSSVGEPEPFIDANGNGVRDNGENYTDINGNGQYDMDRGVTGPGTAGQVTVYTISYPWNLMTPYLTDSLGQDGVAEISSRFVVKNEPFGG
ncbi:MAG: pilus assembly protein [Rhodospirillales bacterium]|nr:pilus assembly protein [Alphaproteobacteria bacterium]MCB9986179.1 pilus assembly protein [Rhodospirillales bacterium]USO07264.1 MAG: pilus assembly protein [Rhodospirillales bacterium]